MQDSIASVATRHKSNGKIEDTRKPEKMRSTGDHHKNRENEKRMVMLMTMTMKYWRTCSKVLCGAMKKQVSRYHRGIFSL